VYLLVTGKPPFSGTREEVVHRVLQERPTDPSQMAAKIAWQLDWVVQRALSKDPVDRFGAAREFMDGLRLGLQESIGAPLPVVKAPAVSDAPAPAPAKAAPAVAAKPAPEAALAQKAKLIAPKPASEPKPEPPKPAKTRVLFVDDEERILNALRILFRDDYDVGHGDERRGGDRGAQGEPDADRGERPAHAGNGGSGSAAGGEEGFAAHGAHPLTGYSDLAALVGSINEGEVFRFVKKPWDNDEIRAVLKEAAAVAAKVAPPPAEKLQAKKVAASILVIDTDNSLAKGLQRMLGSEVTVHEAVSAAEAAKVLQGSDVAAVVGDLRAGSTGLVSLFKLLKAKRPDTLSIMLSDQPDSEVVADCINQAHVHRFLAKPVNARELQQHVTDALQRYASGFSEGAASLPDRLVPDTA
jgi:serine/threonine-protein kinase